jgi:hypothetical protein
MARRGARTSRPSRPTCMPRCVPSTTLLALATLLTVARPLPAQAGAAPPSLTAFGYLGTRRDSAAATAHATLVDALAAQDSARAARWYCPDYVGLTRLRGGPYGRDSVLAQLGRRASGLALLRPRPGSPLRTVTLSDSQVVTTAEYWMGYVGGGDSLEAPYLITYEFRRRARQWCAAHGRSGWTRLAERRPRRP